MNYSTAKEVKLLDRKLGILYLTCIVLVLSYVVGVRVVLERGYNAHEKAYGIIGARLNGTTYTLRDGVSVPHDVASLSLIEADAIFLPTRIITTREQQLNNCSDPNEPCATDADCVDDPPLASGLCNQGHCTRHAWCNADGTTSLPLDPFATPKISAAEETIQDLQRLQMVITSVLSFQAASVLSTDDGRKARYRWNITQIIQRARLDASRATTNGAVLQVVLQWDCRDLYMPDACVPHLVVKDLSNGLPFMSSSANYYRRSNNNNQLRDVRQSRGLRLLVSATGSGFYISVTEIVKQLFVALALFPIAAVLADSIMQHVFSERRHYREYKTELSPDFSDVRAKVEQLERQSQSWQAKSMDYA